MSYNILVISHMYPMLGNPMYGAFVANLLRALKHQGHGLTVIAPVPSVPAPLYAFRRKWRDYHREPSFSLDTQGIQLYRPRYISYPSGIARHTVFERMMRSSRNLLQDLRGQKFDLIHAHALMPGGQMAVDLADAWGIPAIVTSHGSDFRRLISFPDPVSRAITDTLTRSRHIVAVSKSLRQDILNVLPSYERKISVIGNGINRTQIESASKRFAAKYTGKRVIVSVSHLIETKGIQYNLQALSRLTPRYPDLYYIVVGNGPMMKPLKKLVQKLHLEAHVEFTGNLPSRDALDYMNIAECLSLPSYAEGFGIVYIEAMGLGKVAIGCRGQGCEDFIIDGVNGILVDPKSTESVADAIERILAQPAKAKTMGERAQQDVLKYYTWDVCAKDYTDLYSSLLNGKYE